MFLLIPLSFLITYIAWFLIHTFYAPYNLPAYLTFLCPRTWIWIDVIPSGLFQQWTSLIFVMLILFLCISIGYYLSEKKNISFGKFSLLMYIFCLLIVFSFLYLTPNGWKHIEMQAKSVMNVIWLPLQYLMNIHQGFKELSLLGKIQYIFTVPGATFASITYDGSSHPPMFTIIGFALYHFSKFLFSPLKTILTDSGIHYIAFGWGVIVTLINSTLIIIFCYITKLLFSERIARLTGVIFLILPSVVFHLCAVMEGIPTVFTALGILFLCSTFLYIQTPNNTKSWKKLILPGLLTGICFVIAAQFSYGFAVPIGSMLLSFFIFIFPINKKKLFIFLLFLSIPVISYFIFEYFISSGQSFWILRSFLIVKELNARLDKFRPYPMSQLSNFVVMSVMGGILWLPTLLIVITVFIKMCIHSINKKLFVLNQIPLVVRFYITSIIFMFIYLLLQKAVRLEVERTWFWFFFPVWSMMGVYIKPIKYFINNDKERFVIWIPEKKVYIFLLTIQAIISVVLATQIQDYY